MTNSETHLCGRENRQGEPCGRPAGWGTDHPGTGACKLHGGKSTGPIDTTETRLNSLTHGVTADPTNLRARLSDDETAFTDALIDSWLDHAPFGPESGLVERLEVLAVKAVQERRGESEILDEIAIEQPVGVTDDGRPVTRMDEHYLSRFCSRLSSDIRMTLKDLGCLPDPETKNAAATASLAAALADRADRDRAGDGGDRE